MFIDKLFYILVNKVRRPQYRIICFLRIYLFKELNYRFVLIVMSIKNYLKVTIFFGKGYPILHFLLYSSFNRTSRMLMFSIILTTIDALTFLIIIFARGDIAVVNLIVTSYAAFSLFFLIF
jgi:hypothetical protein